MSYASEKLGIFSKKKNGRLLLFQTEETEFKYIKHNGFFVKDFFDTECGENPRDFEPIRRAFDRNGDSGL
ncbi:MAG: hypothetical protein HY889_08960 [Deltaproteobacteria bacterium]|nr:hypothetical protein [Deltaproteobacteria bacterium]